jgi:hypothetical protein
MARQGSKAPPTSTGAQHASGGREGGEEGRKKASGLKERLEETVQNIWDALKDLVEPQWTPVPIPIPKSPRRYR